MPRGASPKREREYEELKQRFTKSGRYGNRAGEVAARIVNKQRAEYGETKSDKAKDKQGKSPDRNLPINDYQHLTIAQLKAKLSAVSKADLRKIEGYEKQHKNRKGAIDAIEKQRSGR